MKNLFFLCLIAGTSCFRQTTLTKSWDKGAFEIQKYRNLFAEMGYK